MIFLALLHCEDDIIRDGNMGSFCVMLIFESLRVLPLIIFFFSRLPLINVKSLLNTKQKLSAN